MCCLLVGGLVLVLGLYFEFGLVWFSLVCVLVGWLVAWLLAWLLGCLAWLGLVRFGVRVLFCLFVCSSKTVYTVYSLYRQ